MSEHTPGPWTNNGGRIEAGGSYGEPSFKAIAIVGIVNQQTVGDTADARLIAAAPDLLEALEVLLKQYRVVRPQIFGTDTYEEWARAAIAKCSPS